ncbi:MAG: DUF2079 domain-containing protein [Candidatus Omnitrophota bacterium]
MLKIKNPLLFFRPQHQIEVLLNSDKARRIYNIFIFVLISYLLLHWFYYYTKLLLNAYNNFLVYLPYDAAEVNQTIWNTSKGRFFQVTASMIPQEAILKGKNFNYLISHWSIIFFLISLLYFILPHFTCLVISHCLLISASAGALYLLAREILTEKKILPLLVLFIYLKYYPLVCATYIIHQESFSMVFLFLSLYFYVREKTKLMVVFSLIAICCREEIALMIALLGGVSYFIPNKRKFFLLLILSGILSFIFINIIRYKIFANYREFALYNHLNTHYGYLGEFFSDKLKNIIFHPNLVFGNILRLDKISLVKNTLGLLIYIPFLSPLLMLPGLLILAELMVSQNPNVGTLRWGPWYWCMMMPFLFMALTAAFERVYHFDTFILKIFKRVFSNSRRYAWLAKALAIFFILILFFNIYSKNAKLTKLNNSGLTDFFSIGKYWDDDAFGVISAIKEKAKVVCCDKFKAMLSSRQYVLALSSLTKEIINSRIYDIILISEDNWPPSYLDKYELIKSSPNYKEIYSTPFIKVFIKSGVKESEIIDNWKFDLISDAANSNLRYNYIFSDFIDFSTILENSNIIDTAALMSQFINNQEKYYVHLKPEAYGNVISLSLDKPLEQNYGYLFAFIAKAHNNDPFTLSLKIPAEDGGRREVKIDYKLRLYMLPFKVDKFQEQRNFLIQSNGSPYILTHPVLFRWPISGIDDITQGALLKVDINNHKFLYNPMLGDIDFKTGGLRNPQFLVKDREIFRNPVIFLMRLFKIPIPIDLYRYTWEAARGKLTDVKAIRYTQ